jgi:alginate O-acetyltransferase complex protein AlgI
MSLSTFLFLCFLLIVFLVNILLPKKARWVWLLIASYAFCVYADWKFGLGLLGGSFVTFLSGRLIGKTENRGTKKVFLTLGLVVVIGTLFTFKYLNFSITVLDDLFKLSGAAADFSLLNLILPLGLSFYTFQAVSYLMDIYNGVIQPEKNFGKFALYLAFFPKLISGPIERGADLLPQLANPRPFEYSRFVDALLRIFWGFFKKLVIADRLAMIVDKVFSSPQDYFAPQVVFAAVAFSLQIYIDFSAYCDIAIGAASLVGIDLTENFNLPYMARSVTEFWRRWHISLTNWLRDYIFTPLTFATRKKRSKVYQYLNIMIVFLVSGIWHGANYTYIIWGLLHGFFQVIEAATLKLRTKFEKKFSGGVKGFLLGGFQVILTFVLVTFAWIFFRADSVKTALQLVLRILSLRGARHQIGWDFSALSLTPADYWILAISLGFFILFEIGNRKAALISRSRALPLPIRWTIYLILLFAVILFGYFGYFKPQDFIYATF